MRTTRHEATGDEGRGGPGAVPLHRVGAVGSTQDVAGELLRAGERAPFAVLAPEQTAGRGRLGRAFSSPARGALALTLVHRTRLAPASRSWFPLAAGVAALDALAAEAVPGGIGLKWPNDLHTADGRKLGGILVEGSGPEHVLLGIGLNLVGPVLGADGLPVAGAAWLHGPQGLVADRADGTEGPPGPDAVDVLRDRIGQRLADGLAAELVRLEHAEGNARATGLRDRYTVACLTLGRPVRIHPLGEGAPGRGAPGTVDGRAEAVDDVGRLVLRMPDGARRAVDVGDVRHLRGRAGSPRTLGRSEDPDPGP